MKWVTGQVRCQVTGRKPTRNPRPVWVSDRGASKARKFNQRCRMLTVPTHPRTTTKTLRFGDIGDSFGGKKYI
jgi:hypothetical protein